MSILKVYASKKEAKQILEEARLIESYDSFVLVEATPAQAKAFAKSLPVEDISDQYQVEVNTQKIAMKGLPKAALGATMKPAAVSAAAPDADPHHYVVQFIGPIKAAWLNQVRATGAELRAPQGGFSYVVRANEKQLAKLGEIDAVRWVGHLPHADRVSPDLFKPEAAQDERPRQLAPPGVLNVEIFDKGDIGAIAKAARQLGFKVLTKEPQAATLLIESSETTLAARRRQVADLSKVHGVKFIRQRVLPRKRNNVALGIMANGHASVLPGGLKLAGDGEVIAVCDTGLDTGDPASIHPDFAGRVIAIRSYPIADEYAGWITNPGADDGAADLDSGHGTHVAGSVLGDGAASKNGPALIRGHAPKASLVFQAVEQEMKWKPELPPQPWMDRYLLTGIPADLKPLFQWAYAKGARIHSNSWGGGDPGVYDDQSRQFDQFAWDRRDFLFVIAAGNDGTDGDADGKIDTGSVTSPGTCKNGVTVGACENVRPEFKSQRYGAWWPNDFPVAPVDADPMADDADQVVAFSSRGPTKDHRVKPDVVAPGTFILSTRSSQIATNNFSWAAYPPNKTKYMHMGGTSMATPLAAGALALIREYLRKKRKIASPTAALVKAMLIAGAQRIAGASAKTLLDDHQGFGRVNLDRSLKTVLATVEGPRLSTGKTSRIELDVPKSGKTLRIVLCYTDYPGPSLVNNLNLMVTDPDGKRRVGNLPDGSATIALDNRNNTEVVEVASAKKGSWVIDVIASNVSKGKQDYAIAAVLV